MVIEGHDLGDLVSKLPDGIHDALLHSLHLDFVARVACFDFELAVGDPDAATLEERDATRRGRIVVEDLAYCALDPPDPHYRFAAAEPVWTSSLYPEDPDAGLPKVEGMTAYRFFVNDWNSFVHITGGNARLQWADE